jgi:hypothetical protein
VAAPVQQGEAPLGSGTTATISLTGTAANASVVVMLALDKDAGTVSLGVLALQRLKPLGQPL